MAKTAPCPFEILEEALVDLDLLCSLKKMGVKESNFGS
jgi:hypothetical protein